MSTEDQISAIGRLVLERTDAKRQCALREHEIKELGIRVGNLSGGIHGIEI